MGKECAGQADLLDAIAAIMGAGLVVLDDTNPVPRLRGPGLDELEDAHRFASDLLSPAQWDDPTFVMLAKLLHAAWPAIHCRMLGIDSSAADLDLAAAVERAEDFLVRIGGPPN
jgi:hypothetical protein